jgi:hypothetical protein
VVIFQSVLGLTRAATMLKAVKIDYTDTKAAKGQSTSSWNETVGERK